MKPLLGSLVLLGVLTALAGCDGDADESASDPATGTSSSSTTAGGAEVVAIVGGSAAGGAVGRSITVLDTAEAQRDFLHQFRSPVFAHDVRAAIRAHPPAEGRVLGAVVIDVSCDVPPSATVEEVDGQYVVTPGKVASPHPECYAAVTSVAVVDLPA
ncbi:hypothetical protein [Nocardioides sp. MH1]|uniref:hypothetical protein n=1 Tax=Nocardioides sp. MH1 TaxID=3242490 RepID=UPI003521AD89